MLWLKAFHIISIVAWFSGLFYLPRLFVYHASASDKISIERFKIMERRLYYAIMTPAAVASILLGLSLIGFAPQYYVKAAWMHAKLACVLGVIVYHLYCGKYLKAFAKDNNEKTERYYRIFNEVPTLFLLAIVILVVVKPF